MASVEIYTRDWCSYCVTAKRLLQARGVDFIEFAIDREAGRRAEMIQRAGGRTTVPQIFIDGRHVGGCTDLLALERSGALDSLLEA